MSPLPEIINEIYYRSRPGESWDKACEYKNKEKNGRARLQLFSFQ